MNSCGSRTSCCSSSRRRSQAKYCSSRSAPTRPSLYFQCAAMPSSAIRCISSVRICTSNGMPAVADDRRVQRLVAVRARHRDEVLEAARNRRPHLMDDAQHAVAVLDAGRDDAERDEVVDLIERDALPLQLLVDRPEALDAPVDPDHGNLRVTEVLFQFAFAGGPSAPRSPSAFVPPRGAAPDRRPAPGSGTPVPRARS